MRDCGCRWDGNLDGKLMRCKQHREEYKREKDARKKAEEFYNDLLRGVSN